MIVPDARNLCLELIRLGNEIRGEVALSIADRAQQTLAWLKHVRYVPESWARDLERQRRELMRRAA